MMGWLRTGDEVVGALRLGGAGTLVQYRIENEPQNLRRAPLVCIMDDAHGKPLIAVQEHEQLECSDLRGWHYIYAHEVVAVAGVPVHPHSQSSGASPW